MLRMMYKASPPVSVAHLILLAGALLGGGFSAWATKDWLNARALTQLWLLPSLALTAGILSSWSP